MSDNNIQEQQDSIKAINLNTLNNESDNDSDSSTSSSNSDRGKVDDDSSSEEESDSEAGNQNCINCTIEFHPENKSSQISDSSESSSSASCDDCNSRVNCCNATTKSTDSTKTKSNKKFDKLFDRFLKDSERPLIRYMKEGKGLNLKLRKLGQEYKQALQQIDTIYKDEVMKISGSPSASQNNAVNQFNQVSQIHQACQKLKEQCHENFQFQLAKLYKTAKFNEIDREIAFAFKTTVNDAGKKCIRYGASIFRRDFPTEIKNKKFRNTAIGRFYENPVFVEVPENIESVADQLNFLRKQLYKFGTDGGGIKNKSRTKKWFNF